MAETLVGQAVAIGQRDYAVFEVRGTYGGIDCCSHSTRDFTGQRLPS
ncbi:MAG: hypothetical protein AAF329_21275 [Cyanobacteria bacterium P01_A01_bin.17]